MYDLVSTWQKEEKWQKFFSEGIILSFRTSSSDLWVVSDREYKTVKVSI